MPRATSRFGSFKESASMSTTTINMELELPDVGPDGTVGPDWAELLNAALERLDEHTHVDGDGVLIPVAALNMNADLDFEGFDAIGLRSVRLETQSAPLAETNDKLCVYVSGGNLYYNNASGTAIKITDGTGINLSTIGSIGGDFSTSDATVTYSDAAKSFLFKQDSDKTADIACGSLFIYENVASANYI